MLEFVHLTGNDGGKDLQTRRKVRSQAMRDFRRRQRADREAANKLSRTRPTRKGVKDMLQQRGRAASAGSSPRLESNGHESPRSESLRLTERGIPTPTMSQPQSKVQTPSIAVSVPPNESSQSSYFQPRPPSRARSESFYGDVVSPVPHHIQPARGPSVWMTTETTTETADPFQSPAQIKQMMAFCKSYVHWLRPGTDTEQASEALDPAWRSLQCPMLLAACCLASVGHLDAVQPNRPGGNYEVYKARVLREVSERMRQPQTATSYETIGTLGMLTSFEISRGSEEAVTHLRGLKSIIRLKGGTKALPSSGLGMMLEILDLLHAILFDKAVVLTIPDSDTAAMDHSQTASCLVSLLGIEQEMFHRDHPACAEYLAGLPELLESAITAIKDVLVSDPNAEVVVARVDAVDRFQRNFERFERFRSRLRPSAGDWFHLAKACHSAMIIFYRLMVHGLPLRHVDNQCHVKDLSVAMRIIKNDTWADLPYLRLFILIRAAGAAIDQTDKSFFKAQLVRAIYQMGASEWRRIKNFMLRFLDSMELTRRYVRKSASSANHFQGATGSSSYLMPPTSSTSGIYSPLRRSTSFDNSSNVKSSTQISRQSSPYLLPKNTTPFDDLAVDPFELCQALVDHQVLTSNAQLSQEATKISHTSHGHRDWTTEEEAWFTGEG